MKKFLPILLSLSALAAAFGAPSTWVYYGTNGLLQYQTWGNGNKIMDFSHAGYRGGGVALPDVATVQTLNPSGGDDKTAIQNAISSIASRPLVNGFRGALQLGPGTFLVSGQININASGVVVRGAGTNASGGTIIRMTAASPMTLFNIAGSGSASLSGSVNITNAYVPSGTITFNVSSAAGYNVGDAVMIGRTVTSNWVHYLGMDTLVRNGATQTWISVGTVITTDRTIKNISGNQITLDVPLTDSFDTNYLGSPAGTMSHYTWSGRISQVGLEHLRLEAPLGATNSYISVNADNLIDSWMRDLFIQDGVNCFTLSKDTKRMTVDSVTISHTATSTVSAGPSDFACTGTQILFNKCQALGTGSWPFVTHTVGTGPIVVLNFYSTQRAGISPHQRWCTGILADNCSLPNAPSGTQGIAYRNRGTAGSGQGWTTGWSVAWNVTTPYFLVSAAPGTENWCIGGGGAKTSTSDPDGIYESLGAHVDLGATDSLYLEQLRERLGDQALVNIGYGAPDFIVDATPASQTVLVGGATNFNVAIGALSGFTSNIVLSVSGLPANTGFNFNPPSVNGSSNATLTITTSNSTPAGVYPLQIIGTSSSLTHTASVSFVVMNFSLSADPASQNVTAGSNVSYTVTLATNASFSGDVALGLTGLPANTGFSFAPPTLSGNGASTLTITTTSNAPPGNYLLTIYGTNTSGLATTTATLILSSLAANPGTLLWNAASGTDQNWSTVLNWTNLSAAGFGPPGPNNSVLFTNVATVSASALTAPGSGVVVPGNINSLANGSFTILALTNFANAANTTPVYHNIGLAPGSALTNTGALQVGGFTLYDFGANNVTTLTISGSGALQQNGTITVSQNSGSTGAHNAVLDLSGLDALAMNAPQIRVGVEGSGSSKRASGIIYLAKTNSLTLTSAGYSDSSGSGSPSSGNPAIYIGHNTSTFGLGSQIYLGIENNLFLDYVTIGRGDTNALLAFNPAFISSGPSVLIRGLSGLSSRVGVYVVGDGSAGSVANNAPSTNDFTGGTVDAMMNYLCVGRGRSGNSSAIGASGVLAFDAGTIDANALVVGFIYATGSNSPASGVVNVNGSAQLIVNSNITLASQAVTTGGVLTVGSGTLNVNGGKVFASSILNGGGMANVTINGGSLLVANSAGTSARGLSALDLTNATLHLMLDGNVAPTNIVVTNLNVGGSTLITIDSLANVSGSTTNRFPLIQYTTFNGSVANFALDDLPGNFVGTLTNNSITKTIDLVLSPAPISIPVISGTTFSPTNGTVRLTGTNGAPGASFYVLASTNLLLPVTNWSVIGTDNFDVDGNFDSVIGPSPGAERQFYLLQIP